MERCEQRERDGELAAQKACAARWHFRFAARGCTATPILAKQHISSVSEVLGEDLSTAVFRTQRVERFDAPITSTVANTTKYQLGTILASYYFFFL